MTIDFNEKEIIQKEIELDAPFVGYIDTYGNIIDFRTPNNLEKHNNPDNEVYKTFERYRILTPKTIDKTLESITAELEDSNTSLFKKQVLYLLKNCYENYYENSQVLSLLFKDVVIQYIGYDAIEKRKTTDFGLEYAISYPRTITTSCPKPNERFFNYLLMGWKLNIVPRAYYDDSKGIYRFDKEDIVINYSEEEQILGREISSIKKLVPLEERHIYFR